MVVVADTSPINYLVLIEQIQVLPHLYARVAIPAAVLAELTHPEAPDPVRRWAEAPPAWLEVVRARHVAEMAHLHFSESEAIALAAELHADALLIDDRAGRCEAMRRGLRVAGTLSVLDEADANSLLNFDEAVERLKRTSFRVAPAVLAEIRAKRLR